MDTRVAVIGVIVENPDSVEALNNIISEYRDFILGRMGIPYRQRAISIVSLALDAPVDIINALSGKLGRLSGVAVKTVCANLSTSNGKALK